MNGTRPSAMSSSIAGASASGRMAKVLVDIDEPELVRSQARDPDRLLDRRVRLRRGVGAQPLDARWRGTAVARGEDRRTGWRSMPSPGSRRRRRRRCGTASGSPSSSTSQSRTWVSSSVQAGLVAHSIPCTPSPERHEIAEDRRTGRVRREEPEEVRRLPVREPRHDDPIEVGDDRRPTARRARADAAGSCARTHPGSIGDMTGSVADVARGSRPPSRPAV